MAEVNPTSEPEEWRPVIGWEDLYEVSSLGRLRRVRATKGSGTPHPAGFILLASRDPTNPTINLDTRYYPRVILCGHGRRRPVNVHTLVARAFLGEPPPGHVVNHMDGRKANNRVTNLEWVTQAENNRHAARTGLGARGDRHGSRTHPERLPRGDRNGRRKHPESYLGERNSVSKLSDDDVRRIRALLQGGMLQHHVAVLFGVRDPTISKIRRGETWSHVQ